MTAPTILAFDTSGAYCSTALLRGGEICAARYEEMQRGQAERLMPLLEETLAEAGVDWAALDRIAVGTGPGNFTGTRIAVSAARGLALGLEVPAIGVSLLDALAVGSGGPVLACLSAPRGRAYVQGHRMREAVPARLITLDQVAAGWAEPGLTCIGSAAQEIAARLGASVAPAAFAPAAAIARNAAARDPDAETRPAPLYVRPADAAPPSDPPPVILDA